MSAWQAALSEALDSLDRDVSVFFRDDDAGWADDRLCELLDVFERAACPIDLAVIPTAVSDTLATTLIERRRSGCLVGFHQHGYSHANHEPAGRPCEFGRSRGADRQVSDIAHGRQRLAQYFGESLDPIFTPPWNRCTSDTGQALVANGIRVLSRDAGAGPLDMDGLADCPIRVDWFAKAKGRRLDRGEWASMTAIQLATAPGPVGIMLHHAAMDAAEVDACEQVVRMVAAHPRVRVKRMKELVVKS